MSEQWRVGDRVRDRPLPSSTGVRYGIVRGFSPTGRVRVSWLGWVALETGEREADSWGQRMTSVLPASLAEDA